MTPVTSSATLFRFDVAVGGNELARINDQVHRIASLENGDVHVDMK
jgi:hypothetical protein